MPPEIVADFDIVAIGEPLYEMNQQPDGRFLAGFGGDTLNVTVAASRLGARAAYATRLGGDIFGEELMQLMLRERIDVSAVTVDADAPTGLYFVTHGPQGHVFTYRRNGSAASGMAETNLTMDIFTRTKILHASGISQAISASAAAVVSAAIARARAAGSTISYDTNYRPRLWSVADAWPVIAAAVAASDIVKTSTEDCAALLGLDDPRGIADHLLNLGAGAVVVTLGRDGVLLADRTGRKLIPGFPVEAVDATGAGDAFTGAMLAELATGRSLEHAARFGNASAALSTLGYGAIAPLPQRPAVEALLSGR